MSDAASDSLTTPATARTSRAKKTWKLVATVVVVGTGLMAMFLFSLDAAVAQYMEVDEAYARLAQLNGKRLDVHGYVVDGTVSQKPGTLQYRFEIQDDPKNPHTRVTAYYKGIVPDTFKGRAEVVATGIFDDNGDLQVEPGGIMAKCPSRYEAKDTDLSKINVTNTGAEGEEPDDVPTTGYSN